MSEPGINLKAKIDGKEVELEIAPSDFDEFYESFLKYRRAYERAHKDKIVREAAEIAVTVGKLVQNFFSVDYLSDTDVPHLLLMSSKKWA